MGQTYLQGDADQLWMGYKKNEFLSKEPCSPKKMGVSVLVSVKYGVGRT